MQPLKIEIDLGKYGGLRTFDDPEALEAWAVEQRSLWAPALDHWQGADQIGKAATGLIGGKLSLVTELRRRLTEEAKAQRADATLDHERYVAKARQVLTESNELYIPAESAEGAYILSRLRNDPSSSKRVSAGLALWFGNVDWRAKKINLDIWDNYRDALRSHSEAHVFALGGEERLRAEDTAFSDAKKQMIADFETRRTQFNEELARVRNATDTLDKASQDQKAQFDTQLKTFSDKDASWRSSCEEKLAVLEKLYMDHMSLNASVTYWRKRSIKGWIASGSAFAAAVIGGVILASYFGSLADAIVQYEIENPSRHVSWAKYSVNAATLFLGAWAIRVVVHIGMRLFSGAIEASEKATMVESYLALSKEAAAMPSQGLTILLQGLFGGKPGKEVDEPASPVDAESARAGTALIRTAGRS